MNFKSHNGWVILDCLNNCQVVKNNSHLMEFIINIGHNVSHGGVNDVQYKPINSSCMLHTIPRISYFRDAKL
jgi:hypothetical protein